MHRMVVSKVRVYLAVIALVAFSFGATLANFSGQVVQGPTVEKEEGKKWIYVKGSKSAIRRVEISRAKISYSPEVSKKDRAANPEDDLRQGAQITVAATQDDAGEWIAAGVEILATPQRL